MAGARAAHRRIPTSDTLRENGGPETMLRAAPLALLLVAACNVFMKPTTPVGQIAEADREVVAPGMNEPSEIRLKKPAKVGGIELAAGSTIKQKGPKLFCLVPAEPAKVGQLAVPPGSEIELAKVDNALTGDSYKWNGVVQVGAPTTYDGYAVEAGDRVAFAAALFHAQLQQIELASDRTINGMSYPAGTLIDIDSNGKISGTYTKGQQRALAVEREQRRQQREQREQDCKVRCAGITDVAAHSQCMGNCRD
jgi:hypothetical protein